MKLQLTSITLHSTVKSANTEIGLAFHNCKGFMDVSREKTVELVMSWSRTYNVIAGDNSFKMWRQHPLLMQLTLLGQVSPIQVQAVH